MTLLWATGTHRGRIRDINQDSVHPIVGGRTDEALVIAVADGMGGHVAGEVASRTALDAAIAEMEAGPAQRIITANEAVFDAVRSDRALHGMGTTLTLAVVEPTGEILLGHVGDSRAYVLHDGVLRRITEDHTVVAEFLAAGKIRPEDVARHPQRSILTRAVGVAPEIVVDEVLERFEPGDRLLLCSDGLSSMISDGDIAAILAVGSPEEAVWGLIEAANRAGGHDNITVAIVDREK